MYKTTHKNLIFSFFGILSFCINSCTFLQNVLGLPAVQPKVLVKEITLNTVTPTKLILDVNLSIQNLNQNEVKFKNLDYSLKINGDLVASGKKIFSISIPGHEKQDLKIPVEVDTHKAIKIIKKIMNGQHNNILIQLEGNTFFETAIGPIKFTIKESKTLSQ